MRLLCCGFELLGIGESFVEEHLHVCLVANALLLSLGTGLFEVSLADAKGYGGCEFGAVNDRAANQAAFGSGLLKEGFEELRMGRVPIGLFFFAGKLWEFDFGNCRFHKPLSLKQTRRSAGDAG